MITPIETERTFIRELQSSDAEGMFAMDSDPDVHLYLGHKPFKNINESVEMINFIRTQYAENGIGRWAIENKNTNEFIGWVGFRLMKETINRQTNYLDFGYRLRQKYWGKGYATEAANAALKFGLEVLKLKDIYAMTDIDNLASRRVLEKIGFHYVEIFFYDGELTWRKAGEPTAWFKLGV
jgi:ribosomal-protein-alanine N-acetyltransferase